LGTANVGLALLNRDHLGHPALRMPSALRTIGIFAIDVDIRKYFDTIPHSHLRSFSTNESRTA